MQNFKQYLEEGVNDYFLYHGTDISGLKQMLKHNIMKNYTTHGSSIHPNMTGISLTRNFKFAVKWAAVEKDFAFENEAVVLKLDWKKLKQNYKIVQVSYWGDKGYHNEFEEFVVGSIKNLNRYILEIWVQGDDNINMILEKYPQYRGKMKDLNK